MCSSDLGPLFIVMRGPLTIAASLVAEHRLQTPRLSSCGSQAQLLRGMWDLPRPGLEPVSPALAGRFSTTAPPGKPSMNSLTGLPFLSHCAIKQKEHELSLRCSSSLVIWGIQQHTFTRTAKIRQHTLTRIDKNVEQLELTYHCWKHKLIKPFWQSLLQVTCVARQFQS